MVRGTGTRGGGIVTPDPDALAAAPFVARDYHGGHGSALYALASTGAYTWGLASEAERAAALAERLYMGATDPAEAEELATNVEALHALAIDAAAWEEHAEAVADRLHAIDVYTR